MRCCCYSQFVRLQMLWNLVTTSTPLQWRKMSRRRFGCRESAVSSSTQQQQYTSRRYKCDCDFSTKKAKKKKLLLLMVTQYSVGGGAWWWFIYNKQTASLSSLSLSLSFLLQRCALELHTIGITPLASEWERKRKRRVGIDRRASGASSSVTVQ